MSTISNVLFVVSTIMLFLTGVLIYVVSFNMVPPMMDAVPNLQWTGIARLLAIVSEFVTQYPIFCLALMFAIVGCEVYQIKKVNQTGENTNLAVAAIVFSGLLLAGTLLCSLVGTYDMQAQMVAGMGLPE